MPYADDLYSMGGDIDGEEDYADQLSPSDGFFPPTSSNFVPDVPDVMVPDPSLDQREAEAKAREAAAESSSSIGRHRQGASQPTAAASPRGRGRSGQAATASYAPSSRYRYGPAVTHPPASASASQAAASPSAPPPPLPPPTPQRTPSVYSDAPPPAYTPSPTSTLLPAAGAYDDHTQQQQQFTSYSTFSINMGAPDPETERLLGAHVPQSMGGPSPGDEAPETPSWRRRVRKRLPAWVTWKVAVVAVIVLVVTVVLMSTLSQGEERGGDRTIWPVDPVEQQPPEDPEDPTGRFEPTFCEGPRHRFSDQILSLDFDGGRGLTFEQRHDTQEPEGRPVRVGGQVDVRRLDEGGSPRVVLETVANDPDLRINVVLSSQSQLMQVRVPQRYASAATVQPCVELRATIWVPPNAVIGELTVGTVELDIRLLDDLSLRVADRSRLFSVSGDVSSGVSGPATYGRHHAPEQWGGAANGADPDRPLAFIPARAGYVLDSRVIEVHTTSGRIDGNWPLYDKLGLSTTSGDVDVGITPHDAPSADPGRAAVLALSSTSGTLRAAEPLYHYGNNDDHYDNDDDSEEGWEKVMDRRRTLPPRNYVVDVRSASGDVRAALAFGPHANLMSTSSDLQLDLLPVVPVEEREADSSSSLLLTTVTSSGQTNVRVREPVWLSSYHDQHHSGSTMMMTEEEEEDGTRTGTRSRDAVRRAFRCLRATHRTTSGDVALRFPQSWEGDLTADSVSGRLAVAGRDVRVLQRGDGPGRSLLRARKGPGHGGGPGEGGTSLIAVHAVSGDLDAVIGDV
ncbi:hypothetical protein GGR56DRAFT_3837 [Xylariaceae sp. FL0804]|nr:hypothetical protein GGR56DRAFT_3837 [Xylariaceae sp. FL0804]